MTEEKLDKVETTLKTTEDKLGKHNVSSRSAMATFIFSYLILTISVAFGVVIPSTIVETSGYILLGAFALVTLGINGVKAALEGIATLKKS